MRGNKFEKSHIHILESETLSRESTLQECGEFAWRVSDCEELVILKKRNIQYALMKLMTIGIFFEKFWEVINDTLGANSPIQTILQEYVNSDKLFYFKE